MTQKKFLSKHYKFVDLMMMTNKRPFDDEFNMPLSNIDLRKQFLTYLNQSESCELFYIYMKSEQLAYVLEFYLACDGLKDLSDNKKNQSIIIELIYKHYLSYGKCLSSSSKKFSLPDHLISSIKQRLINHEYHLKFYDQAQEYVLKYMLQMCYPKFLIQQKYLPLTKRQALNTSTFTPTYRRSISTRKKDIFDKFNSLEGSMLTADKQEKNQHNLAQRNPAAFFEELKTRLLAYQTRIRAFSQSFKNRMIDDDPSAILDLQIAKTINDDDNYLCENSIYDSGVGTDSSERNYETFYSQKQYPLIDVIWYPSLDSKNALLSTIPHIYHQLTFKQFRQLFKKQTSYRYFFKTTCTPDINKEQYVFRELTMDDELVPYYNGKIFVQLDRIC